MNTKEDKKYVDSCFTNMFRLMVNERVASLGIKKDTEFVDVIYPLRRFFYIKKDRSMSDIKEYVIYSAKEITWYYKDDNTPFKKYIFDYSRIYQMLNYLD